MIARTCRTVSCRIHGAERVVVAHLFTGFTVVECELCCHQSRASAGDCVPYETDLFDSAVAAALQRRLQTAQNVQVSLLSSHVWCIIGRIEGIARPSACLSRIDSAFNSKTRKRVYQHFENDYFAIRY